MFSKNFNACFGKFGIKICFLQKIRAEGSMKEELNSGVRCNVTTCVYNENGCNCNKNIIDVSQGDKPMPNGGQPHFCKSYINKK